MPVILSFEMVPMLGQPRLTETKVYVNNTFVALITHVYSSMRDAWEPRWTVSALRLPA